MKMNELVHIDPEILSGTPVFAGTRIPIQTLFDYLETSSLDDFLVGFPTVNRKQAETLLSWTSEVAIHILKKYESAA